MKRAGLPEIGFWGYREALRSPLDGTTRSRAYTTAAVPFRYEGGFATTFWLSHADLIREPDGTGASMKE